MAFKFIEDDFKDEEKKVVASNNFVQNCGLVKEFIKGLSKAGE